MGNCFNLLLEGLTGSNGAYSRGAYSNSTIGPDGSTENRRSKRPIVPCIQVDMYSSVLDERTFLGVILGAYLQSDTDIYMEKCP